MHIVMISDWETQHGGAAVAASRLANALAQEGHQVTRIVAVGDQQPHSWATVQLSPSTWGWAVAKGLPQRVAGTILDPTIQRYLSSLLDKLKPDIINIHNIHGARSSYWGLELVSVCARFAPIVWTLHDMWSFTGRCAYTYDCQKYLHRCDESCPTPGEYPSLPAGKIRRAWNYRRKLFQEIEKIAAVSPTQWLARHAVGGMWRSKQVEVIAYGLPLDIYQPIHKSLARKALGLDVEGPVLLLAAHNLEDRRKGLHLALQAIDQIRSRPLTVLLMGSGDLAHELQSTQVIPLGYIDHERTRALAYSAADLYVHPALADNLPNMVLESISCGTPVVAFEVGGLPEMVELGVTGWLVEEISAAALASGLENALTSIRLGNNLNVSCREFAGNRYAPELQARRYLDLFKSLS
jgi:glycosyltransferase involved in cell wall biosynthesis